MKRYNYIKVFAGLSILLAAACKTTKTPSMGEKLDLDTPLNTERTLLWQVSGNGLDKPSYIFGTMHLIHFEQYNMGANVEKKLKQADKLIMEVDLKKVDMMGLAQKALLAEGKTMKDYVSEDEYNRIQTFFNDSLGISPMIFNTAYAKMKPFFLDQLLIVQFLDENPASYESEFASIAEDENIPTEGLETMEEQLAFLDNIPLEEQYAQLLESIDSFNITRSEFKELSDAYADNDLTSLSDMIEKEWETDTLYKSLLLTKRNIDWIPKLKKYFAEGSTFVAIGAGHLGGSEGIIAQLRKEGYKVDPISID